MGCHATATLTAWARPAEAARATASAASCASHSFPNAESAFESAASYTVTHRRFEAELCGAEM